MKYLLVTIVIWACTVPGLAAPILVFNPQSRPVTADISFQPATAGLPGVPADGVILMMNGATIPCQAEDGDGDGTLTDQDTVYAAVPVQPGNNWLEAMKGEPAAAAPLIAVKQAEGRLQVGWMELDARNGRPLACVLADSTQVERTDRQVNH